MATAVAACPCGTGRTYDECCGVFHDRTKNPRTAEQLMRSRYSAYVVRDANYLLWSWHPDHRPAALDLDPARTWLGLTIVATQAGDALDATGIVEFTADFANGDGEPRQLHERSTFARFEGRWTYLDGASGSTGNEAAIR